MGIGVILVLCSFAVDIAETEASLMPDNPFVSVPESHKAYMECCYKSNASKISSWVKMSQFLKSPEYRIPVVTSDRIVPGETPEKEGIFCATLNFTSVMLNDTGLYQCHFSDGTKPLYSHGTYLLVHKSAEKIINLSENTKNRILTAEGILLLLCVLLPSATLLFKSKKLHELEKKKVQKEEENIYQVNLKRVTSSLSPTQGLNLDECCSTYDQIECSQTRGPYQDVCNIVQDKENIQLEKP